MITDSSQEEQEPGRVTLKEWLVLRLEKTLKSIVTFRKPRVVVRLSDGSSNATSCCHHRAVPPSPGGDLCRWSARLGCLLRMQPGWCRDSNLVRCPNPWQWWWGVQIFGDISQAKLASGFSNELDVVSEGEKSG